VKCIPIIVSMIALSGCGASTDGEGKEASPSEERDYANVSAELLPPDAEEGLPATDCAQHARSLAIGLCVNRTMHFLDGRSELSGAMEAEKLSPSCEPFHATTVMQGYDIAAGLISQYAGQPNVTEDRVRTACALQIG